MTTDKAACDMCTSSTTEPTITLRQWVEGWFAAGLMTVQAANAIVFRMKPLLDRPFDEWATSVTWTDLVKLPQMGRRGIANVAGLLRLSGYDLRGYAIEADPRKLLDIRPE